MLFNPQLALIVFLLFQADLSQIVHKNQGITTTTLEKRLGTVSSQQPENVFSSLPKCPNIEYLDMFCFILKSVHIIQNLCNIIGLRLYKCDRRSDIKYVVQLFSFFQGKGKGSLMLYQSVGDLLCQGRTFTKPRHGAVVKRIR